MDTQLLAAVIVPLVITFFTLIVTWLHNSASISHQRTQRLMELVQSGAWRTTHPLVLVMSVREAFGLRVNLDARALRLALEYEDQAFEALQGYLKNREFIRVSDDGLRFQGAKVFGSRRSYKGWPTRVYAIGLTLYATLLFTSSYLVNVSGYPSAIWLSVLAGLLLLACIGVARSLNRAERLLKLPPIGTAQTMLLP
ncbi:hypothetical protein [Pseudomonas fildesensis]|uniref:Uncharacterized protein n=1 Tax=Pseudomonas fildesensis TaxID=1674920 RepID=A0A0J8FR52_9PSED|nr:hypothetical protein [Pseudomonas fildesensis]KMT52732.1 hypothetical protein ACR52_25825 [Pseudomonas fildesensis]